MTKNVEEKTVHPENLAGDVAKMKAEPPETERTPVDKSSWTAVVPQVSDYQRPCIDEVIKLPSDDDCLEPFKETLPSPTRC